MDGADLVEPSCIDVRQVVVPVEIESSENHALVAKPSLVRFCLGSA